MNAKRFAAGSKAGRSPTRSDHLRSTFLETIFRHIPVQKAPLARPTHKSVVATTTKLESTIRPLRQGTDMTELMTFEEVAKRAKLPLRTLYYLHQKGRGPKATKLGRHLRVTEDDFFAWINSSPHK